ncbi:DNA damage-regulated autophagy modulator protein 1-like [Engystomops pustulosus]|uniref:DNA damage-regulated autophagy modulator protein 1-like n=1 Tax=Engystomops pustulosus TaxID=76066 RepID=UPI003AFA35F1
MEFSGLGFVPSFLTFWCMVWLSTSYILTLTYSHSPPLMFISEAGNYYPEKIPFKIGFIGMSIATLGLMFLQYKFIQLHAEAFGAHQPIIQKVLLVLGWTSCGGIVILAVCETRFYPLTHRIAAFTAFICGSVYNLSQAIILYKAPGCSRAICHIRTASCVMALICVLIFTGCQTSVHTNLCRVGNPQISAIIFKTMEWLILLLILINVLTYHQHMQSLSLTVSKKGCNISTRANNQDSGV